MPQDNIDTVKAIYQAFATGDIPFVLGVFDPQIEWNEAENFLYADRNPYVGAQAILDGVFARLGAEWDNFSATPEEIVGSAETVVSFGRYRGTFKKNGAAVNAQFVHVFKFRNGKAVRFQQYTDTAQFRDVATRGRAAQA
jgi:ketosteroid isomerase-like protein